MFDRRNRRSMPMKEKKRKRKGKRRQVLREICPFFFLDCFWFWFWFWFGLEGLWVVITIIYIQVKVVLLPCIERRNWGLGLGMQLKTENW